MSTLRLDRHDPAPLLHHLAAPLRAVGGFLALLEGARAAAAEIESLSRLSDAALARRGIERTGIAAHAARHLEP